MHPIEHLRYLARVDSTEAAGLVAETATALGSLRSDPATLVVACRRILERHATVGQMWWMCSHLLLAADPGARSWELADEVADDATAEHLARRIVPGGTLVTGGFDVTVIEALSARDDVTVASFAAGDAARQVRRAARFGVAIEPLEAAQVAEGVAQSDAVVVGLRAGCPGALLVTPEAAVVARAAAVSGTPVWLVAPTGTCMPDRYVAAIRNAASCDVTDLDRALVEVVISPSGATTDVEAALRPSAPMAPELLRVSSNPVGAR